MEEVLCYITSVGGIQSDFVTVYTKCWIFYSVWEPQFLEEWTIVIPNHDRMIVLIKSMP